MQEGAVMIKLGIVGLGHMGGYHAAIARHLPSAQLTAIADPHEEMWEKVQSKSCFFTKDYQELASKVDAVIIATPTNTHYKIARFFLENKIHVLIEKPLTPTKEEAEKLFDIADKNKCVFHVGHVERFNGALQELKKIIHNPYLIEAHRIGPFSSRVQDDSVVLDLMIHDIDLILGLVDSPVAHISTVGKNWCSPNTDIALVHIKFENGALANIVANRTAHIKKRTMQIHQEDSFINLNFSTQDISIHQHTKSEVMVGHNRLKYRQEERVDRLFVYKENPLKQEILYFLKAIKTRKNIMRAEQDLAALDLTLQIVEQCKQTHL